MASSTPSVAAVPMVSKPRAPTITGLIKEDGLNGPTTCKALRRIVGVAADAQWARTRKAIQK